MTYNEIEQLINECLLNIQDSNKFECFDFRFAKSKQVILFQHDYVSSLKYDEDGFVELEYSTTYYQYDMSNFNKESLTNFLREIINSLES